MKLPAQIQIWFALYWQARKLPEVQQREVHKGMWDYLYITREGTKAQAADCTVEEAYGISNQQLPRVCCNCFTIYGHISGGALLVGCPACQGKDYYRAFPGQESIQAMAQGWSKAQLELAWLEWFNKLLQRGIVK